MLATVLPVLLLVAGSAAIAVCTAFVMTNYTSHGQFKHLYTEYTWRVFSRTMLTAAAIVASAYGFTEADDIIRAIGSTIHGTPR